MFGPETNPKNCVGEIPDHAVCVSRQFVDDKIAHEAYLTWVACGRPHGTAEKNWLNAELRVEQQLEIAGKAGLLFCSDEDAKMRHHHSLGEKTGGGR